MVQSVASRGQGLQVAAEVARRLGTRGALVEGALRAQRGTDGLNEHGLVPQLAQNLAVLRCNLAALVEVRLEDFQDREGCARQHHGIDGERVLGEVVAGRIDRGTVRLQDLDGRFTNGVVTNRGGALDGADIHPALEYGLAGEGTLDHARELFDDEGKFTARAVLLVRSSDQEGIVQRHCVSP